MQSLFYVQLNIQINKYWIMSRGNQKVLQLHSLLSKILDSLCLQLAVTSPDENSLSLLEILMWRRTNQVNQAELKQLYISWLEAKNVSDIFKTKQTATFDKKELITVGIVQQHFMNVKQVTTTLQIIDAIYNELYLLHHPHDRYSLQAAEQIFGYLDTCGLIHLRISSLFFFCGGALICQGYSIPVSYETFKVHLNEFRRQMCQLNGLVSLRWFKNFILFYPQRNILFKKLMGVFAEIQKNCIKSKKNELPNLMDQAIQKWKQFPRFSNGNNQTRNRIQIYRRVFQENQNILYDQDVDNTLEHFTNKYGTQFIKCFQIDNMMLRQFATVMKESLNRYLDVFRKVGQNLYKTNQQTEYKNNNSNHNRTKTMTQLQPTKATKRPSNKDKTPTKVKNSRQPDDYPNRTPTQRDNRVLIHRQFGSAERIQQRTYTPTKSIQPNLNSHKTINQRISKPQFENGVNIHFQTLFFRNKRIETFDTVMKRLKKK